MVFMRRNFFKNGVVLKNESSVREFWVRLSYSGDREEFSNLRFVEIMAPGREVKIEFWSPGIIPFGMNPIKGRIVLEVFENKNLIGKSAVKLF